MKNLQVMGVLAVLAIATLGLIATFCTETIPAGHVGVGTMFGKVQERIYNEGFNLVNPMVDIIEYDARQKTRKETMGVPSADQLITKFTLSIQYRLDRSQAPSMLRETGGPEDVINVHMIPALRSQLREIGKSVRTAEEFYLQEVQQRVQHELFTGLQFLGAKGIQVDKLLIREVVLPGIITDAVKRKKEAAQAAEKAKEELKKFEVDQRRVDVAAKAAKAALLTKANAKLEADTIAAKGILIIAKAKAKAKKAQIDVVGRDGYIKLEAMKALGGLANGNHMIIMDPSAVNPIPFMNLTK